MRKSCFKEYRVEYRAKNRERIRKIQREWRRKKFGSREYGRIPFAKPYKPQGNEKWQSLLKEEQAWKNSQSALSAKDPTHSSVAG